ncbi:MAG: TlpA family protein disulfide reductase [Gammaproteobacteria bacterium]|nr:MAG: TlpA family protein disulfide reductase [Gammaproteobacteria bacterium]
MKPTQILGIAIAGLVIGAGAGIGIKMYQQHTAPLAANHADANGEAALDHLPDFQLPDLDGRLHRTGEWDGRILVLNFWASWCPPCREETPLFVELARQYEAQNVRFVGVAIDDREPVKAFVSTYGVDYPILMGDMDAITLSRRLGNRYEGLPFTVVIGPDRQVLARFQGGVDRNQLEPILQRAIEEHRGSLHSPERI